MHGREQVPFHKIIERRWGPRAGTDVVSIRAIFGELYLTDVTTVFPDGNKHPLGPERKLMIRMLMDVLTYLLSDSVRKGGKLQRRLDLAWLKSNSTGWVFDYVRVCDELGLDASWFRKRILSMIDGKRAGFVARSKKDLRKRMEAA